jgi:hypothetical protein
MTAVFMARNTTATQRVFSDWLACYDPSKWDSAGKYIGSGGWAGVDYEQGAFWKTVLPMHKDAIQLMPWNVFHEIRYYNPAPCCWSIHLCSNIQLSRRRCMNSTTTHTNVTQIGARLLVLNKCPGDGKY